MLKGKTKIILTNVETGEQEVHEDENLVTNALGKIININVANNHPMNTHVLPLATKTLGGLFLFDGELTEDPENIHFPVEAHLVGYGNHEVNTVDEFRGSYNSIESGKTSEGYVSVWDFGTSQCNGTIKSVARTSDTAGADPFYRYISEGYATTGAGVPSTDTGWTPIRYDGEYLYMLKGNSSTHEMRMARVKIPTLSFGVADYSSVERVYELVASWNTELTTYEYYNSSRQEDTNTVTVYADTPLMYEDGHDGFIYCVAYNPVSHTYGNIYPYDITYFTIKYGDGSYEKSETKRLTSGLTGYPGQRSSDMYWAYRGFGHVNNGKLYMLSSSRKFIYIIPLDNVGAYTSVRILSDDTQDYVSFLDRISPYAGGVYFEVYHYTTSSYEYLHGIVYPDGVFLLPSHSYDGSNGNHGNLSRYSDARTCDADLTIWNYYGDVSVQRFWDATYLGTINNLGTTITKTAAQTMKIIYTLIDVTEEDEQDGGE